MLIQIRKWPVVVGIVALFCIPAFGQAQEVSNSSIDKVANEIGLLRKTVETLNVRLGEIGEKVLLREPNSGGGPSEQKSIGINLELLARVEQRGDMLRKQLLDSIEREAALRVRLTQLDEEMRPENIERSLNVIGTTRTAELRETRRRVLENERRGVDGLLTQILAARRQLEEDVRQSDTMISRLRERLFPLIEKEIDKIKPE